MDPDRREDGEELEEVERLEILIQISSVRKRCIFTKGKIMTLDICL